MGCGRLTFDEDGVCVKMVSTDEDGVCVRQECSHRHSIFYVTDSVIVSLFKPRKHVKLLLCRQASCVKLFFNYLLNSNIDYR